jgi:hypothetical protein
MGKLQFFGVASLSRMSEFWESSRFDWSQKLDFLTPQIGVLLQKCMLWNLHFPKKLVGQHDAATSHKVDFPLCIPKGSVVNDKQQKLGFIKPRKHPKNLFLEFTKSP